MNNNIIIFKNQEVKLYVNIKDDAVWLTQKQMSELFNIGVKTMSKYIINVYLEELDEKKAIHKK